MKCIKAQEIISAERLLFSAVVISGLWKNKKEGLLH